MVSPPLTTDNYRSRVLKLLARELGLPKLNFQVLRRTMATLAQTKGGAHPGSQQGHHG
jgi:hypothetical protein